MENIFKLRSHLIICILALFFAPELLAKTATDSITVYIFMREDCKICQNYNLEWQKLHEAYSNDSIRFVGVFPNFSSKPKKIKAFKEKYQIPFDFVHDYFKTLTLRFGATVTPEVVVFNHNEGKVLYKGRTDNSYFRVGKRRTVTTTSELEDALEAIKNGQPIEVPETTAIGCFINFQK